MRPRIFDVLVREWATDLHTGRELDARLAVVVDDDAVKKGAEAIWGTTVEGLASREAASEEAKAKVCRFLRQDGNLEKMLRVSERIEKKVIG